ncbi:hypothetical protein OPT61_g850 [Boeremia exigua]|uniref:Uncharacterized protein n=1 Tax=Boeremia exigua TaxID=749465 RepID=A0ACC2ISJ9_9PLEO|nr:hypothetical protein OPT61_g850 [Boeremia exigua]
MNTYRSASFNVMYVPPQPHLEYEVTHHHYRGPHQIFVSRIGIFSTLRSAQRNAQEAFNSALNHYIAKGFTGYYCDDIDLDRRGLVTGLTGPDQYTPLSEIHIRVRAAVIEPVRYKSFGREKKTVGNHNNTNQPTGFRGSYNSTHNHTGTPVVHGMPTFAQSCSPYTGRPADYTPRMSISFAETTTLPTFTETAAAEPGEEYVGNALGGGVGIGKAYVGRRHSAVEVRELGYRG